jgi:quercetin dioxygenase-like cupin family protein
MHRITMRQLVLSMLAITTSAFAADAPKVVPLMNQPLVKQPNQEVVVLTVEYGPGQSSPPHRHNADVFVYVLEGKVTMAVQGKDAVTLGPGQTFHELPSDIHSISRNASDSAPAKFLVFMVKDKGAPATTPVQ